jgi:peptidyl-prolyl cis-trans isomerase B (cyclophilin B)
MEAHIITNKGTIKLNLFYNEAPVTVSNFVNLSNRGYYSDISFHRVIENFMVQGGCPLGTGIGGPGYEFDDEFHPDLKHDEPGVLSMANSGPGTNGSQFFITHVETPWLDNHHTVFGKVMDDKSKEIVDSILQGDKIAEIKIIGEVPENAAIDNLVESWNTILDKNN